VLVFAVVVTCTSKESPCKYSMFTPPLNSSCRGDDIYSRTRDAARVRVCDWRLLLWMAMRERRKVQDGLGVVVSR
jgi:hypothetical protein